jgi:hypothetical protein
MWVAQGHYLSVCASNSNKGLFNGVFWVFFMISQIVGNTIGATILSDVK